jgi:hypothetical protein
MDSKKHQLYLTSFEPGTIDVRRCRLAHYHHLRTSERGRLNRTPMRAGKQKKKTQELDMRVDGSRRDGAHMKT